MKTPLFRRGCLFDCSLFCIVTGSSLTLSPHLYAPYGQNCSYTIIDTLSLLSYFYHRALSIGVLLSFLLDPRLELLFP